MQPSNFTGNLKPSEIKPWLKYFPVDSVGADIPKRTIYERLKLVCEKLGSNRALYYYGTRITYRRLLDRIDRCAEAYQAMGVKKGDTVSFLSVTLPELVFSMYALNKIGAVGNFIDPRMDKQRIAEAVSGVHSRLLVTLDLAYPKVEKVRESVAIDRVVVVSANDSLPRLAGAYRALTENRGRRIPFGGDVMRWKDMFRRGKGQCVRQCPYEEDSVAVITYTGGTTGYPKGVMLTNDGLNAMADSFVLSGAEHEIGDRFLEIMPIFAAYGVGCGIHMPLVVGMEDIVIPQFNAHELGRLIAKYRPNHMMGVPDFYEKLMHSDALQNRDLSFLLTTGCGGDTMNPGLEERFNRFLREHHGKYPLSQGYGMSEMSGAATCCFNSVYKDDSSGIPLLATTVGVFDPDTGEELGFNKEGEICMTGRNMMKGYYNEPEETARIMRRHDDGRIWIHSGDIGYMDEDGFIFIKGRIKQIIIRFDGHKVFPVQIERVIVRHNAVGACAVIGIPDPDHSQGMVPLGVVELKLVQDKASADYALLRREIMQMCDEFLEERGKPADIVFVDELMRTGLNKHDYRGLTEAYRDYVIQR